MLQKKSFMAFSVCANICTTSSSDKVVPTYKCICLVALILNYIATIESTQKNRHFDVDSIAAIDNILETRQNTGGLTTCLNRQTKNSVLVPMSSQRVSISMNRLLTQKQHLFI